MQEDIDPDINNVHRSPYEVTEEDELGLLALLDIETDELHELVLDSIKNS